MTKFIDHYAQIAVARGNLNTISIGIYKDGLTYHNYYGSIDADGKDRPSDNSLFEIASISKTFTGGLMARAIVNRKTSLDADIRQFLPSEYPNLSFEGKPITIKHLVTHTMGFETPPGLDSIYKKIFSGTYNSSKDLYDMSDLFEELKNVALAHEPGTYYDYNNVGPELVAYILEQLYGKAYESLLSEYFEEMGMQHTYLQNYEQHRQNLINTYTEEGNLATIDENPLLGGASGIITTLPDLVAYLRYQLTTESPHIEESSKTLFENQAESLGYFWDTGYGNPEGYYFLKSGTSNGTQSIILICPDSNYGQILIMNNTSEAATNEWIGLYGKIEKDLIQFPKLNLWSALQPTYEVNPKEALEQYKQLSRDSTTYFASSQYLNMLAYDHLFHDEIKQAIAILNFAIETDPENANLYDSLGEVYYKAGDIENSKLNFSKSLEINPDNSNAQEYLEKLAE